MNTLRQKILAWGEATCNYDRSVKQFERDIKQIIKNLPDSDARSAINATELFIKTAESRLNRRIHNLDDCLAVREQNLLLKRKVILINADYS